jgi:hypothetical protein
MRARSRSIEAGDETAGVRLEYVRSRRVLRLGGWHSGGSEIEAVEMPASALLPELGIDPDELGAAPPAYLLLAGVRDERTRGIRRATLAFSSEHEARQAFRRMRTGDSLPTEWAELFALDIACRLRRLCWFGEPDNLAAAGLADLAHGATSAASPAARWRRTGRRRTGG